MPFANSRQNSFFSTHHALLLQLGIFELSCHCSFYSEASLSRHLPGWRVMHSLCIHLQPLNQESCPGGLLKREKNIRFLLWTDTVNRRERKKTWEIAILAKGVCEGSFTQHHWERWGEGVMGAKGVEGATSRQQKWWLSLVPTHMIEQADPNAL